MIDSRTLRIIDANANRAREALRVIEDYARFALDSAELSGELKRIRHAMGEALEGMLDIAILHRDTAQDVGTTNKTATEFHREDLSHVITAAGKRLCEALRCLEECAKTVDPARAGKLEKLRYRFYVIEQTVALTLSPARRFEDVRLYVLISSDHCGGRDWREVARLAIEGGADCLQLREKAMDGGELLARAGEFVELCKKGNVLSIINDRVDVAIASGADGVHVGQTDLPAREVRKLVGRQRIVGVSTQAIEQARKAVLDGADYIGIGPVFRSSTKTREILPGLDYARKVAQEIRIPAVAIAGITLENVDHVIASGIRRIAVTAAVTSQADVRGAARALKQKLASAGAVAVAQ